MTSLFPFEINFTLFFQSLGDWLSLPFKLITSLGIEEFYILIMPLLFWCVNSLMGIRAGIMLILSGGFKDFLKIIFHSPRPYWVDTRVKAISLESSFGIPSGHAMDAASIWGSIAASIKRRWATWLALILIFLIGLSRIYLGVHFIHDVIGGWLVGGLLLWGYLSVEKKIAGWANRQSLSMQILLSFLVSVALILLALLARWLVKGWQLPAEWITNATSAGTQPFDPFDLSGSVTLAGVAFGFLAGLAIWVKKYGMPVAGKKSLKLIFRYLVGMVGLAALYIGLKMVLPEEPELLGQILRFLRYALIGIWVTAIAPLIFKKLKI